MRARVGMLAKVEINTQNHERCHNCLRMTYTKALTRRKALQSRIMKNITITNIMKILQARIMYRAL